MIYDEDEMDDEIDNLSTSIVRDSSKCILCRRCVSVCAKISSTKILEVSSLFTFSIFFPGDFRYVRRVLLQFLRLQLHNQFLPDNCEAS